MAGTSGDASATPSAFHGTPSYPVESVSYNDSCFFRAFRNSQQAANIQPVGSMLYLLKQREMHAVPAPHLPTLGVVR